MMRELHPLQVKCAFVNSLRFSFCLLFAAMVTISAVLPNNTWSIRVVLNSKENTRYVYAGRYIMGLSVPVA